MNSTPPTSASIIRLTALTPPPPTPTTRSSGWRVMSAPTDSHSYCAADGRAGCDGDMMFSGRSDEKAWRRRSCGVGVRGGGVSETFASGSGCRGGSAGGAACCASWTSSVFRKRAASGPSRMLARLPLAIREHLLRQLAIGVSRRTRRVVLEHRHALHGSFREPDRLLDARAEHAVAEVLFEDLERLLGVQGASVDHRGQDARDLHVGIQVLADHREGVLQLQQPTHGQI